MKILYGVQATGNGHIARARAMARAFSSRHVEVDYLLSGRERHELFGVECLGNYQHRRGLTFDVRQGRVRYVKTALRLPLARTLRDIADLDVRRYDLVISDFEPITAWAARMRRVPSLGISHQCAFRYAIPKAGGNPLARGVLRLFAPVQYGLGLHWDSFGFPIIPPLIDLDRDALARTSVKADKIVVYLPFESREEILSFLGPFTTHRFVVYMGADPSMSRGHVQFRNYDKAKFQSDLLSSAGVICNAGFELPSECIHLGKKLLVKPVYGQMEQLSNALALVELGYGNRLGGLDKEVLNEWLSTPAPPPRPFGDVAGGVVDWLLEGRMNDTAPLAERLWSNLPWCVGDKRASATAE